MDGENDPQEQELSPVKKPKRIRITVDGNLTESDLLDTQVKGHPENFSN